MKRRARDRVLVSMLLASGAALSWPDIASAQSGASGAISTPSPAPAGGGLQDIVVTARKRAESVQSVPVAVTAFTPQVISRQDLTSIEKIAAMTPQFTVGRAASGSGAQLSMRGIGSNSTSIGIEQSVAVVVDGVYYGQGRIINEGFFDLARVEILKGPQSLFFGKNATAGVVSLTSADPADHFEAQARASYEFRAKQPTIEGVVSIPITDTLGLRLAGRVSKMYGGYYRDTSPAFAYPTFDVATGVTNNHEAPATDREEPQTRELLGRATLKWHPTSNFTATIKASGDSSNDNNVGWNNVIYACANGFSTINPSVACRNDTFIAHQNDMPREIAADIPHTDGGHLLDRYRSWGVTGTLEYKLDKATITSITNFNRNRNTFNCDCSYQSNAAVWGIEYSRWRSFSNETRITTDFDGPINMLAGFLYQSTRRDEDQATIFANIENSAAPSSDRYVAYTKTSNTRGETVSGFGQVQWRFLKGFELAAGARYTHETKKSFFIQPYVNPAVTGIFVPNAPITDNPTWNNWSPEVTLSYRIAPDIHLYGAYKTAYKSGGFSNSGIYSALSTTPKDDLAFEPEKARGFEAGLKTELFDRQLRFNVTAYRYKYSNLQVDFFNAPTFAYITINAGAAITKGIETEFEFAPRAARGLSLHGSLNYNRARYRNFIGPCFAGQTIAQGCPLPTGPGGFPLQDLSGKPTAVAPAWTATLGFYYEHDMGRDLTASIGADGRYSSHYLASSLGSSLSPASDLTRRSTGKSRWVRETIDGRLRSSARTLPTGSISWAIMTDP